MNNIESNMEVEYKFWANISKKDFHQMINEMVGDTCEPFYVCSCDDYYITSDTNIFLRHRKGGGKTELTIKAKREGNVVRKEVNLDLTNSDDSDVVEFLQLSGYEKRFSIFKEAWIWDFSDCDLSYYTLSDGRSVVEIEAKNYLTPKQGVEILNNYVTRLGIDEMKEDFEREKRSLYEIFSQASDKELALNDALFSFSHG